MVTSVRPLVLAVLPLVALAACSDGTGVGGTHQVALNFRVSSAPAPVGAPAAVGGPADLGGPLVVSGTNGTLTLDQIRLIVSEVELEKADDDACSGDDHGGGSGGDGCKKFEAGPRFLDLPLDGQPIEVVTDVIPPGVYHKLEFEIEDLEDDEDSPAEAALIAAVRAQVLAAVPDWPRKASALIVGSFTPTGGTAVDFRVFVEAEIEVEMDLVPDLVVEGETSSRDLTVDISPELWFAQPNGTVVDLSQYDFDSTGRLLELEVEFEGGFGEIEIEVED